MSFIIVGVGRMTWTNLAPASQVQQCVWCARDVVYNLIWARSWLTCFFIPVYAYRQEYRIECPLCGGGIKIRSEEAHAARRGELTLRSE